MIELFFCKNKENRVNLTVKKTGLALLTIFCLNAPFAMWPAMAVETTEQQVIHDDINKATIAGQTTSSTATVGQSSEQPVYESNEIVAVDNLLNLATGTVPKLATNTHVSSASASHTPLNLAPATGSFSPITDADAASESAPAAMPADTAQQKKQTDQNDAEFIDTLYPDPLSPDFPTSSGFSSAERNRPALEIIDEINSKAEDIARKTAAALGIDYVPPQARTASESVTEDTLPDAGGELSELYKDTPDGSWSDPGDSGNQDGEQMPQNTDTEKSPLPDETAVIENITATDTEDIAEEDSEEIVPIQWPDSETDPEFASATSQIPETERPAQEDEMLEAGKAKESYEKTAALEPVLMLLGKPADEQCDLNLIKKLTGRLIPEIRRLARKTHLYRWVIETDDGRRFPLKSNLKLLTEVRNEKLLDGRVNLSGQFASAGADADDFYFVVETITAASPEKKGAETSPTTDDNKALPQKP